MMALRRSGALSALPARMQSAYRLCNYLLIGMGRKSWAHSQSEWREGPDTEKDLELAGQVGQSLIFWM
jgi:hypothetical protein